MKQIPDLPEKITIALKDLTSTRKAIEKIHFDIKLIHNSIYKKHHLQKTKYSVFTLIWILPLAISIYFFYKYTFIRFLS